MRRGVVLLAWLLVHCGDAESPARLDVLLLTDYRTGLDFVEANVEILEEISHSRAVTRSESFLTPADLARFDALPRATRRRVRVTLLAPTGAVLQRSRVTAFRHERARQLLARICAACEDFACPLGQTCECGVVPQCVPDECVDEACDVPRCGTDADCGSSTVACVDMICREGSCLGAAIDSRCGSFEYCDVGSGCVPDPATGVDAGIDSGTDAGIVSPPLADRGLIARFFLDEGSGSVVRDASGSIVVPLTEDPPGNPTLTLANGFGGLRFAAADSHGRACLEPMGTPLAGVSGSGAGSLEAVVDLRAFAAEGSRFIHFGAVLEWDFSVGFDGRLLIGMNDSEVYRYFDADLVERGRSVITAVFDGTLAPADRLRVYLDGDLVIESPAGAHGTIPTSVELSAGSAFCLGNREVGDRSFEGVLHYAAVYSAALTDTEVRDHAVRLLARDDR